MGLLSREKQPLQQLHSKKGDGRISKLEGGLIFGRLVCIFLCYQLVSLHMLISLKRCLVHPYRKASSYATVWYEQSVTHVHMCIAKIGYSNQQESSPLFDVRTKFLYCYYIVPGLRYEGKVQVVFDNLHCTHTCAHTHTYTHAHT